MLVHRFHVIYVEVPSGHSGVDDVLAGDKQEVLDAIDSSRMMVDGKRIAVIGITEAR